MSLEIKKKIVESTASDLTTRAIALLLPLLASLVVAIVPQVRVHILPGLATPLGAVIIGISLSLNLALIFYILHLRKTINLSRKLTPHFGVLWSHDHIPHCPACSKPLSQYGRYKLPSATDRRWALRCIQCDQIISMANDKGRILELIEAKKLLANREQDTPDEQPTEVADDLDETSLKLLRFIGNANDRVEEPTLIRFSSLHPQRAKHHLDLLEKGHYIYAIRIPIGTSSSTPYYLAEKGRDYLIQHELI